MSTSALVLALLTGGSPSPVRSDDAQQIDFTQGGPADDAPKLPRNEWAGFPVVAGSSDIGVQIGAAVVLTRLTKDKKPYAFRTDLLASVSFKGGPRGYELVQQHHGFRFDAPAAFGTPWRLEPGVFVERTVNAGYFGIGNATPAIPVDDTGRFGSRYQYVHFELRGRLNARYPLDGRVPPPGSRGGPWWLKLGAQLRYVDPRAYAGSQLETDQQRREPDGEKYLYGTTPIVLPIVSAGILWDTRDDEIVPTRGAYDSVALRTALAFPTTEGSRYVGATVLLQHYFPLWGPLVFATRFFGDALAGNVPFYDLSQGGAFVPMEMLGGPQGVRGVPNGRFNAPIKVAANAELRAMFLPFKLFGERFELGAVTFGDVGRAFSRFGADPRDGKGLGLKFGVGGGLYLKWGQAAIFRLEVAYSPWAKDGNPGVPVGIYAADGQMF